jgi:S-adenosylmethionine:tRNA ribosyltransferase-isomerase
MPIPSYINRPAEPEDFDRYQTVFAKNEGAVIAPAAGLHFSRSLLKRLEIKGCEFAFITVHSGLGNFREIDVEDLTKHKMDSEQATIKEETVQIVNRAKNNNKQICAVGTSVNRAIESTVTTNGYLKDFNGWTNKFIFPPYDFSVTTSLITNFHLPLSTMLMHAAAFGGFDLIMDVYKQAIKEKYHFGAYGDAMLII